MKIGNINFDEQPIFFAPMEDVSDPSFRLICKEFGADMMYTEFISADGLIRNSEKSIKKTKVSERERPVGVQIYGKNPEDVAKAAQMCEEEKPDLIDLNFGCPVKKIAGKGAGAGLLQNIPLLVEITKQVVNAVKIPVTVKTRLGWDEQDKPIVQLAEQLQDVGIAALTVHGRTSRQLYKGEADWTLIGEIKKNQRIHIPIIGNGDVKTPQDAKQKFEKYGVDAIMVGRAAIGKPWIFKEIKHYLKHQELLPEMTVEGKVNLAKKHFQYSIGYKGEITGVLEMRKHFSNYFKGLKDFKNTRIKLVTENDPQAIFQILDEIAKNWI